MKKSMIINVDFKVEKWGNNPWIQRKIEFINKNNLVYASDSELRKLP
ncbi:exonuclease V subunit alpha [Clostridium acetobutylicum]|nr:exonuclease V subunit alpha [Clostridium acetobutylicum]